MKHLLLLLALLAAPWARAVRAADGVPPRPKPFTFVTDQAGLLQPADVKRLDSGLRQYADNNGTQVVVVTVPSLGGQDVNAFARQLGNDWGLGQKDKNNGLVVLVAKQEHKLSIEPGLGLRDKVTPSVIQQAISKMTPQFKQNDYGSGLRSGLNVLLAAANPGSAPKNTANAATSTAATSSAASSSNLSSSQTSDYPSAAPVTNPEPASGGGIGIGTILLGVVVIGGGLWLVSKLFRRNSSSSSSSSSSNDNNGGTPNFYPNRPSGGQPAPYPNQGPPAGGGYGYGAPAQQSSGPGIGGILATGAAAAAGAYLGNRMAEGHDSGSAHNFNSDGNNFSGAGTGSVAGGTAAADDYFASRNGGDTDNSPDYFSGNDDNSNDYFSGNDNSYDDSSGGGGFDDTSDDNSGSW